MWCGNKYDDGIDDGMMMRLKENKRNLDLFLFLFYWWG